MSRLHPLVLSVLFVLSLATVASAAADGWDRQALYQATQDSARCGEAIRQVDSLLAQSQDLLTRSWLLTARLAALQTLRAPATQIADWADSAVAVSRIAGGATPALCGRAADELLSRGELLDRARGYIEAGLRQSAEDPDWSAMHNRFLLHRARLEKATGAPDSALATVEQALKATREDDAVYRDLLWLNADLCEQAGRLDQAARAHVRVAGAAFWPDTTRAVDLRRVWTQTHGSLGGLAGALEAERVASRRRLIFEVPRVDRELPTFALRTLAGPMWETKALRDRVAVIDFWGTWCPGCVQQFPDLQKLYERFKPKGVRFVAVDVEFQYHDIEGQRKAVAEFVTKRHFTVPVLLTEPGAPPQFMESVSAFPTTWIVDRHGRIRFENQGGREEVLAAQIESLLKGE